jgi:RND family efflux transporter MFP subunit
MTALTKNSEKRNSMRILSGNVPVLAALLVSVFLLCACSGGAEDTGNKGAADKLQHSLFLCPMHPQITSDKPGSCSICGMDLVEKKKEESVSASKTGTPADDVDKAFYLCPMHPQITSDKSGSCPICGMDLVLKQQESQSSDTTPAGLATVNISQAKRGLMGLTFSSVEKRRLQKEIRTSARIVPDETKLYRVTTKIDGYVDKLYVNVSGQEVKQGQPLLSVYSPELVASQQEFLAAVPYAEQLSHSSHHSIAESGEKLLEAARRRLQLWDITDAQIDRLQRTGKVEKYLTLFAPSRGYVIEKNVLPGQKIMPGEPLLVVADLSSVWAEADIYESDLPYVHVGMPVALSLSYWPGKTFEGTVSFLFPYLDPQSRTLKARMNVSNPELLLKGEMYADAHLLYDLGECVAVPETAVMNTGARSYVFLAGQDEEIIPREVRVGNRVEGYYEVLDGLQAGERVVTSANFLVDSESSLKAALQAITGGRK